MAVRHALLNGDIEPGIRLKIGVLCERFQVNLSAMREALTRLAAEGIVIAEAQRGFRSAPVSLEDLQDLTRVRVDIETLCLRRSIEHGDIAWESRVVAAAHMLLRTPKPVDDDDSAAYGAWRIAHIEFHAALCSACGSSWLLRLREQLNTQSERYLRLSLKLGGMRRPADDEHRRLSDAVLARDAETASLVINEHFWVTTQCVVTYFSTETDRDTVPHVR